MSQKHHDIPTRTEKPKRPPVWMRDGFVRIPLAKVLEILNYRIEYTEDDFRFFHRKTSRFVFAVSRLDYHTPWEVLHESGVFERIDFDAKASAIYSELYHGVAL